jgi:pyrimidine operon attenuation protein/uracil phosphoribosyltransferase
MKGERYLLQTAQLDITLLRLAHQLIENYDDFEDTCIIGIQPRGGLLSDRLKSILLDLGYGQFEYGKIDITFYRDDFRHRKEPLRAYKTQVDFLVENKRVILVDDVLFTGRTVQSALTALADFGRPKTVELLVLVDRRFHRELPLEADYVGAQVDALDDEYVRVEWKEPNGQDAVKLLRAKGEIK